MGLSRDTFRRQRGGMSTGGWIAVGIALGVGIGVAMDNVPMGIAVGVAIGAGIGAGSRGCDRKGSSEE